MDPKLTRRKSPPIHSPSVHFFLVRSTILRYGLALFLFFHWISPSQSTVTTTTTTAICPPPPSVALDEHSVVLITGAAGFIGSALAMALHRVYHVQHLILIDSMDATTSTTMTSYGSKLTTALTAATNTTTTTTTTKPRVSLTKTRHELALRELKRQRIFHVLQTLGSAATFYRADVRPTLPEYFDIGEVPMLDYIFQHGRHPTTTITHVVHLADAYPAQEESDSTRDVGRLHPMESTDPHVTQAVPRIKEHAKAGMMETLLEQLYKLQQQQQTIHNTTTTACPPVIPHLVYASSYEVYNHLPHRKSHVKNPPPFDEAKPITTPSSLRGATKLMDELLVRAYHSNYGISNSAVGLRFFCVYGPWGTPASPLYELAQRTVATITTTTMENNNDVPLLPDDYDSHHVRDYVYIDDAVDAIMAAMQFQTTIPVVMNVGTGVGSTMRDIVTMMHDYLPPPTRKENDPPRRRRRNGDTSREDASSSSPSTISIASTERAKQLLGFEAQVSLQEGIGKLLAWHYDRAHPNGNQNEEDNQPLLGQSRKNQNASHLLPGIATCAPLDQECFKGAPVFPCASECSHPQQCQPSYWDTVARWTQSLTATCETVLYTVDLSEQLEEMASAHHAHASSVPGASCNVAFVSETSVLVRQLRRAHRIRQESWWSSGRWLSRFLWSPTDVNNKNGDSSLLRHGIWTLVTVLPDAKHAELSWLPKLSPGFLFGSKTRRAIYCDPNVVFESISKLLDEASQQPVSQDFPGATAMLVGKRSPYEKQRRRRGTQAMTTSSISSIKEAVQQVAYRMVHIAVHEEMSQEVVPLVDSSFVVHTLQHEDSRQFRCDVYGEVVQWEVASDDRPALQLMLGLHEMWSRVLVQHGGMEPWWVGDSVQSVPEDNARKRPLDISSAWFSPSRRRRLQSLGLFTELDQDEVDQDGANDQVEEEESMNDNDDDAVLDGSNNAPLIDLIEDERGGETREQDADDSKTLAAATRRLDNVEEGAPENEETDGSESLKVNDGFGNVPRLADPTHEADVIDGQEDENDGSGDEDDDEDKEKENLGPQGAEQIQVDVANAKVAEKVALPPPIPTSSVERDATSRPDTWMGVLSSTPVHYFVRIVPPSMVGVVYLDEK